MNLRAGIAAAAAIALAPAVAIAVDGVILIDQNKALAGSVTPGDAAGFPITISRTGSYRLSGNLTVPAGTDGIVIAAPGVTLDLNGFTIASEGGFPTYAITDANVPQPQAEVRNGRIEGFTTAVMLQVSAGVVVEGLRTFLPFIGTAVSVGAFSRIQGNINTGRGHYVAVCPSLLIGNVTSGTISVAVQDPASACVRHHNRGQNFGLPIDE